MFKNILITALRFFAGFWRHILINMLGLATGLYVFFLAVSLQEHERRHDDFFADAGQIFGVYTRVLPTAGFGTGRVYGAPPVVGPLLSGNFGEIEALSRYVERRHAVRVDEYSAYESVKFVDPAFTEIFQFQALTGDLDAALESGAGLIMTREAAQRYFGRIDVLGESLRLGGSVDLAVMAVIEDLPANSHFVYRFGTADRMQIIAPMEALEILEGPELFRDWGAVSDVSRLWLKIRPGTNPAQLADGMSEFLLGFVDETGDRIVGGFAVLGLMDWNLSALDANGLSLISVAVVLCGFILLVAVLNYSNLFTAMVARRLRELAVRKILGAGHWQLSVQVFIESLMLTAIAAIFSFMVVMLTLPALGAVVGKDIAFANLLSPDLLIIVIGVTVATALLAVAYPIYVVNRLATIRTLRGQALRGRSGARLRFTLVVVQFSLNAILATLMATTYMQNQHLLRTSPGFNGDNVVIVSGLGHGQVNPRQQTLAVQLANLPGVVAVSGSSQHPYQEIHNQGRFSRQPQAEDGLSLYRFAVGPAFFSLYDIELEAGRSLMQSDDVADNAGPLGNVLLNRAGVTALGFADSSAALDQVFYGVGGSGGEQGYRVVGVVADANLLGLANDIKPSVFRLDSGAFNYLSLRLEPAALESALTDINGRWQELFPEIPAQSAFLEETFRARFGILTGINRVLMGISIVSILLAISGLFGLISVLSQQRRHEIAIRKVLGATVGNLMGLLSWQFTKPVSLALVLGVPVGMLAATQYLNLFAERLDNSISIAIVVGLAILALAWLTISAQILRVAQENPSEYLRSE